MLYVSPEAVITVAAFGDQAMDMRVPFKIASKGVEDHNKTGGEVFGLIHSNFPQGFLMKSLINSDFVSIIMLTYTGLDKTYDLAHYTKRAPAFGIIRSTKIHSYTERSARSYDNPKCKK
jgi:hypothetical protein